MQIQPRLKNKSVAWAASLKPRVGDVVLSAGVYYSNISGVNSAVSNTANWFPNAGSGGGGATPLEVDKTAGNISASGSDYIIDLSAAGLPAFPVSMRVYVDLTASGDWEPIEPVSYSPVTGTLRGMNSPTDYPSQLVKILVL